MSPLPLQPDTFHWDETESVFPKKVSIFGNYSLFLKLESMQYFETKFLAEAQEFIDELNPDAIRKLFYSIRLAEQANNPKLFKKLHGDIWEFRVRYLNNHIRLLAFWDKTDDQLTLVFATHGFIKKTGKIPDKEIERAKNIRDKYFDFKQ